MEKRIVVIVIIIMSFVAGLLFGIFIVPQTNFYRFRSENIPNISVKRYKGKDYYIINDYYNGDYDYQTLDFKTALEKSNVSPEDTIKLFNTTEVLSYDEYSKFCERWNLNKKYTDSDKRYMVIAYWERGERTESKLVSVVEKNNMVSVYLWEEYPGDLVAQSGYFMVIPVDKHTFRSEVNLAYTDAEYNNLLEHGDVHGGMYVDKPIIYIYPEKETNVSVKLSNPELLTVSYPKYEREWNVVASVNGNLYDKKTNRNYYGLYYEAKNHNVSIREDGFIVKGEDSISFLESKLSILGLNEREINEFIIYWLPKLEVNKYNYIRFETQEEIDEYMKLDITPKPDSLIRVVMDYKPLNEKIEVKEQKLIPQVRHGYSVIEWGGSEI